MILDVITSYIHPAFNNDVAYFDVAVLVTQAVNFSMVSPSNVMNIIIISLCLLQL